MHQVKILNIKPLTHNVKRFTVEKPVGYQFDPGQATEIAINKPGWREKKHPFTFTSLNQEPNLEFTIKIYPVNQYPDHSGMTEELGRLTTNDELLIGNPWGTIKYQGSGNFIAGGAGVTPFIAIFRQLATKQKIAGNSLIFSNKTKKDIILESELKKIFPPADLHLVLTGEKVSGYDHGRIDKDYLQQKIANPSQHFYVCGPKQMVGDIKDILKQLGAKLETLVFEK